MNQIFQGILSPDTDPMGAAIQDYHTHSIRKKKISSRLIVHSSQFDDDYIPLKTLFRSYNQMPMLEKIALDHSIERIKASSSSLKILDVGAGSGCHSLELALRAKSTEGLLNSEGPKITSIDISPLSVDTMKERGVSNPMLVNIFDEKFEGQFDIILMLMNGAGIIGKIDNLPFFFSRMKKLLSANGEILMDSSDLKYLFEEEDGSFLIDISGSYYGEVDFQMEYKPSPKHSIKGSSFDWLYIDFDTLALYAKQYGFEARLIKTGEHWDYLVSLSLCD